jgi:hypothetical protein
MIFGPLAFGNMRSFRANQPLPSRRRHGRHEQFGAYEVIAILNATTSATVRIPPAERRTVALIYDPNKFKSNGWYRLRNLDHQVRFVACKSRNFNHGVSQFDGGFMVTTPQCVRFDVRVPGHKLYVGEFPAARPCKTHGA